MNYADLNRWRRAGLLLFLSVFFGGHSPGVAANSNPTVTFNTNTNQTNPARGRFQIQLFSVTSYTNSVTTSYTNVTSSPVRTTNTNNGIVVTNIVVTNTTTSRFTNDSVFIAGGLQNLGGGSTNPIGRTNLVTNGLVFSPSTGLLSGVPTTNFILAFTNSDLRVLTTNQITVRTNVQTNILTTILSNNFTSTIYVNVFFTNTYGTNSTSSRTNNSGFTYRFVFQLPARITNFPLTNMGAFATSNLPTTNGDGLAYGYQLLSGEGSLSGDALTSTGILPLVLRVSLTPVTDDQQIWTSNSTNLTITKINPALAGFGFATNTNLPLFTATNLAFQSNTPLLTTNAYLYQPVFIASNTSAPNRIFYSNHPTIPNLQIPYLKALAGTGSVSVTATVPGASATLTVALTQAPAPIITMEGKEGDPGVVPFSSTNTNPTGGAWTNTSPSVTTLRLQASSSAGYGVGFSSSATNVARVTNGSTLVMVGSGTSVISASNVYLNTNNYASNVTVTNTLVVAWTNVPVPVFTSTNRQDGVQGVPFTYLLRAGPDTNAFPITYNATNLAPGLVFVAPNKIVGAPTNAGLFRMQLTASNAAGITTNVLTSVFAPGVPFSVTSPWAYRLALGTGTNSNGSYAFPAGLSAGIGSLTNSNGGTPPVLVLSNANTNPFSGSWFAGISNLSVVFSNSQTNFTSSVSLNVRPVAPSLSVAPAASGNLFQSFTLTGSVSPAGLTNTNLVADYPLRFFASNLPTGVTLGTNGVVTGTPQVSGVRTAQLWASNAAGASARTNVVFVISNVAGYPCEIPMAGLFSNATGTYASTNLPPGLKINPFNGLVSGMVQAVGNLPWTVTLATRAGTNTNSTNVFFGPPVPQLMLASPLPQGRTGQPYAYQPWVTGPGWGWAGADALVQANTNLWWESRMVISNSPTNRITNRISANSNGAILATTQGLSFSNNPSNNVLALLWNASLPSSWPWQATLRMRVPGTLTNGLAGPFLGVFRAQTPFSTNFYDRYAEAFLDASAGGKIPGAAFLGTNTNVGTNLTTIGTNEIAVRLSYDTNGSKVVMAVNTNPSGAWTSFTPVLTNTNLSSEWNLTNVASAFRVWVGFAASNQMVSNGQVFAQAFAIVPGGAVFSASNLPAGLAIDSNNGTIYGAAATNGVFTNIVIRVSNGSGRTNSATNSITILP